LTNAAFAVKNPHPPKKRAQRVGNDAELMQAAVKILEQLHPGIKQR
jgi:hypothetical protein